ncbi:Crp/Fnr family transcriptional regulator [Fulvivirga ligni]|uniref:Crp/Fnr family transcriptional regulator n=1 Tax=Fulvivirga ligni TaxID=2904246 RepID=UPI001F313593|nr:Crp/Fnr family transcriptional regulator [Fulvivirga ligni]UII19868.1 Crp/Fnr family transcriptional regulator [Fulvivirga ligni]
MYSDLYSHITQFVELNSNDFEQISSYYECKTIKKKKHLLKANDLCKEIYFVTKGCLHLYFIDDSGTEKTVQFAMENWWLSDFQAFNRQSKTNFFIQAVETTDLLHISFDNYQKLLTDWPIMERYYRQIHEIAHGASLTRMRYIFNYSKEEVFYRFREQFPEFVQRVPQYLVASFLGLTPEYLSKIRGKKLS